MRPKIPRCLFIREGVSPGEHIPPAQYLPLHPKSRRQCLFLINFCVILLLLFLSVPLSYRKKTLFTSWKKESPSPRKKTDLKQVSKLSFSLTCIVLFHDPCDVPVLFPTFDGFTLVIIMFPFSEPQKQFGIAILEIDL